MAQDLQQDVDASKWHHTVLLAAMAHSTILLAFTLELLSEATKADEVGQKAQS